MTPFIIYKKGNTMTPAEIIKLKNWINSLDVPQTNKDSLLNILEALSFGFDHQKTTTSQQKPRDAELWEQTVLCNGKTVAEEFKQRFGFDLDSKMTPEQNESVLLDTLEMMLDILQSNCSKIQTLLKKADEQEILMKKLEQKLKEQQEILTYLLDCNKIWSSAMARD